MSFSCTDAVDPKVQKNKKYGMKYILIHIQANQEMICFMVKKNPSWTSRGSTKTGRNSVSKVKKGKGYLNL